MTPPDDLITPRLRIIALTPQEAGVILTEGLPSEGRLGGLQAGRGWPHDGTADGLGMYASHGATGPFCAWLVVDDATVVGDIGCHGGPNEEGSVEIGYGFAGPYRGNGLATEAVSALVSMLREQPDVRTVMATTERGNEPSQRLLERIGFVLVGQEGENLLVYTDGG